MAEYMAAIDENTQQRLLALPRRVHFQSFAQKAITAFAEELEKNPRLFSKRFGKSCGRRCETYTVFKTMAPHHRVWTGPDKRNYDIFDFPLTASDNTTLILETGTDITAQKQAEDEIIKINQELKQRVTPRWTQQDGGDSHR